MFAKQIQELMRGIRPDTEDLDVMRLVNMLGNCSADLEHRGRVKLLLPPEFTRGVPDQALGSDFIYAPLELVNYNGWIDPDAGRLHNGAAAVFRGPVIGVANLAPGNEQVTINNIAYYTEGATYVNESYANSYYTVVEGTPVLHESYAVTQSVPSFSGGYPGLPIVSVKECADASGSGVTGSAFNAYMPRTMKLDPYAAVGSVVGLLTMPDGTRIVTGPFNAPVRYYKATANWTNNGAGYDYVAANPCLDQAGSTVDTGTSVNVQFLTSTGHGLGRDPNVIAGQVFPACQAPDGTVVCVDPSCYDARIGFMQPTAYSITTPQGWGLMDGVENHGDNGGSARVMTDRYCKASGAEAAGVTGGAQDHTHDNHTTAQVAGAIANHTLSIVPNTTGITVDSHASGTTDNATTGITVNNAVTGITISNALTGITIDDHSFDTFDVAGGVTAITTSEDHTVNDPQHTHAYVEPNAGAGHTHTITEPGGGVGHSHTFGALTHTVNDPGHAHTISGSQAHAGSASPSNDLTHSTESNDPEYLVAYWYERLDNSD